MKRKIGLVLMWLIFAILLTSSILADGFWLTVAKIAVALTVSCSIVWLLSGEKRGDE
jgi:hypothetical protein